LFLGFAVASFATADDPIYVLLFANQAIFSGLNPGPEHTNDPGNIFSFSKFFVPGMNR
jgi:hypothetical protein